MTALAARRRHPLATAVIVLLGLVVTGLAFTALAPGRASAAEPTAQDVAEGRKLFLANCSTCHGTNAEGRNNAPPLIGVGAASVDFQVGTGRMPLQATGPQAPKLPEVKFSPDQVRQLAAYVASLGPGPAIPDAETLNLEGADVDRGALIYRTNCAMCHNFAGRGGALTQGKYAPTIDVSAVHIYEAMQTGPQSMPVFNDQTLDPQSKRDIIAYLETIKTAPSPGGFTLGSIGPVSEGLVAWVVGLAALIGCAVWLGAKAT